MRTYKIIEGRKNNLPPVQVTYVGFNQEIDSATTIAVLAREDGLEVYAVDDKEAFALFIEHEKADGWPVRLIGYFNKEEES